MIAFVILAAGRGSRMGRVGDVLPKCLAPLQEKAVLSHIIGNGAGNRIIIVTGYKSELVEQYVRAAYPFLDVEFVRAIDWDQPSGGPGSSLLAARKAVGDNPMLFTSCDTLWTPVRRIDWSTSWVAVAPTPIGTAPDRWCRVIVNDDDRVVGFLDKTVNHADEQLAYTGLGFIRRNDLQCFWTGLEDGRSAGELQVTPGLERVADHAGIHAELIQWTDVGDEGAYRQAVEEFSGYDWVKTGQVTYVMPDVDRVVKFAEDPVIIERRVERAKQLTPMVPEVERYGPHLMAYDYVRGKTAYDDIVENGVSTTHGMLTWWREHVYSSAVQVEPRHRYASERFYVEKTNDRITMLRPDLRQRALDAVSRIDMLQLAKDIVPGVFHGDFNYGNVIAAKTGGFVGIDWREDFAGHIEFGDLRYDLGKMLAGTVIHWGHAQVGDFSVWTAGPFHYDAILRFAYTLGFDRHDLAIIGALSLINSAPLHASPLDEIAVTRACRWLERI